jgi:uncharacterized protein YydD (DUF2326 family)
MFLKSLRIATGSGVTIRDIQFRPGLNLIVDETPIVNGTETGNNVGKTTVLKLVDVCLGAKPKGIYTDRENRKNEYKEVRDYLISNKVLISLVLKDDLQRADSREVVIDRNFLSRKEKIQRVDGRSLTDDEYEEALTSLLYPGRFGSKPTFRQIISHNVRYEDLSLNNTLKILDSFTRDDEYETLYLFLLGVNFEKGDAKQELRAQINVEEAFKRRLEAEQTQPAYETALSLIEKDIDDLEQRKRALGINPSYEADLDRLTRTKYRANACTSDIGRLELRRSLIVEAQAELQSSASTVDVRQLRSLYEQATDLVKGIQKTFEELNDFHNQMVRARVRFITSDLPRIDAELAKHRFELNRLLSEESELKTAITGTDSFEGLEAIIVEINEKYRMKGEYENTLRQLRAVDSRLAELKKQLNEIDAGLFSEEFAVAIKEQVNKFNRWFAAISQELYGEKYALKADIKTVKNRRLYEFTAFNLNFSSGKKQGEIACFDIAYTFFADEEAIPCMHFLLNDKKELMHDNQLVKIARLVNRKGIQFVSSILKDKLPVELNKDEFIILKLSQGDKLFRIESKIA